MTAYSPTWAGDNYVPRGSPPRGPGKPVERDELEAALNEIVGSAWEDMNKQLAQETQVESAPADAAELMRLKLKYKYKYKYKYRTQNAPSDPTQLLGESWDIEPAVPLTGSEAVGGRSTLGGGTPSNTDEGGEGDDDFAWSIPKDELSTAQVAAVKEATQDKLDETWSAMAAPSSPASPAESRRRIAAQRDQHMPTCRRLKKMVGRLDELAEVLGYAKDQALQDAKAARAGHAPSGQSQAERELVAEGAGDAAVQRALDKIGEADVNSTNLLHTTKHYNLIGKLRHQLGVTSVQQASPSASNGGNKKGAAAQNGGDASPFESPRKRVEQASEDRRQAQANEFYAGDWNKSVFVRSKKQPKVTTLGKGNRTWKEYCADPWERQQIVNGMGGR